jgi:uncharacterized membrane protein
LRSGRAGDDGTVPHGHGCSNHETRPRASDRHWAWRLRTEPFWSLLIDEHDITFVQPEQQPIKQPTPKVIVAFAGEVYQTPRINVNIVHAQCSDGMSDRVYPDKVQVTVDGRQFNGCGGL